jgi:xanthine dehydrogenase accessory factor
VTAKNLLTSFEEWRQGGGPLVLASVYETAGSTYSKAGARMLINADGDFQGMLSGGCLEGDLADRARQVVETGKAQAVTYDLGLNDEELWGLGVGCDGLMKIFLQPLIAEHDFEPFGAIARLLEGERVGVAATILDCDGIEPGATLVTSGGDSEIFGLDDVAANVLLAAAETALADNVSSSERIKVGEADATVLLALVKPPPRLLVLGAGLDAEPVTRLSVELGWRTTVHDHRPGYIENGDFSDAESIICGPAEELSTTVSLSDYDATIVMSHHLASDRTYLIQLAKTDIPYIGLLGPRDRRKRLLEDLGDEAALLEGRVHGPAGLDIGASGPAAIALAILAEAYGEIANR